MAATDLNPRVVCDAGPLIHLDELGCLGLLADFQEVLVPSTVRIEVMRHRPSALGSTVAFREVRAVQAPPPDLDVLIRTLSLHEGERESLCIVRAGRADLFLTDDTAARLAARSLGIPVHGTIGLLFRAIRMGRKTSSEVTALLRALPSLSSLHIGPSLLEEFIRQAERAP
jgi:predicted nucleic acid-binding protein